MLIATLVVGGISLMVAVVVGLGEWRRFATETSAHNVTLIDHYVSDATIVDPNISKGAQPQITQITGSKNLTDLEILTESKDSDFTSYFG